MSNYTVEDLHCGSGMIEQAMRSQSVVPGAAQRMTQSVAISVLAAAMRSGLPAAKLDEVIEREFAHSATLLRRVLDMYEGNDWDIHLWHRLPSGKFKLCTALCQPNLQGWRYDPSARIED